MAFLREPVSSVSGTVSHPASALWFPEENLLSTDGFFITSPGALLKEGRYKIIRKLGRGRGSNTFLVEDLQPTGPSLKYLAAKALSASSTIALQSGLIHELDFLQATSQRPLNDFEPPLPILRDHFAQPGPHGVHYCFLMDPYCSHVNAFRASSTGKLAVHIVKPIIACVIQALKMLHSCNIIHTDINADNVLFVCPGVDEIEEMIAREPPLIDGTFEFQGTQYPILRSQPFQPRISWDASPLIAETIWVELSDVGSALWADQPKPPGDIGPFALRAPENLIRAECGKEIDIWAIGCMTYELLTGQILFRPQPSADLTVDQSLLLLQYALTGVKLNKELTDQSRAKDQYFDAEGNFIKAEASPTPRITLQDLLTRHTQHTKSQIEAAAEFIGDCLRLNPSDRPNVDQLQLHRWLEYAFMGCMDKDGQVSA